MTSPQPPLSGAMESHKSVIHHINEFGDMENVVHGEVAQPSPKRGGRSPLSWILDSRRLQQYYCGGALYRTKQRRHVAGDELFLDLVIVAAIAALGHELREGFEDWRQVETFFLLFGALYSSWRTIVALWNLWGIKGDLLDKLGIYVTFTSLIGVALGAHGPFERPLLPYVSVCAFLATAVPALSSIIMAESEPLLARSGFHLNHVTLNGICTVLYASPYLAAAFVSSPLVAKILYWIAFCAPFVGVYLSISLVHALHINRPGYTFMAFAIEHLVEKYEILTMIVLGESVLGLVFEGSKLVTVPHARLGGLFGVAATSASMLYSLQTLYLHVDGPILKGGRHALRYRTLNGILWSQLHILYHMALILFATGLGASLNEITLGHQNPQTSRWVSRISKSISFERFDLKNRWLFSAGWGMSIILSAAIGALHSGGPRARSKWYRLPTRVCAALAIMIGLPFSNLGAENYIAVHNSVLIVIAFAEYMLVRMDRARFFKPKATKEDNTEGVCTSSDSDSESGDNLPNLDDIEIHGGSDLPDGVSNALKKRMTMKHNRMVLDQPSDAEAMRGMRKHCSFIA